MPTAREPRRGSSKKRDPVVERSDEMDEKMRTSRTILRESTGSMADLRSFGRQFWLVNTIEMLERGAYYGMVSILVFHFVNQRGYETGLVGALVGLLQFLLYFVPLFAAALAEKYGYRPGMVAAFVLAGAGYLGLASTGALEAALGQFSLVPGMVLLGIGAGTFKPIAAAAIARATTAEQRNLGFTIYYAGVNVGGFLGPFLIGVLLPGDAYYGVVFYGAAAIIALNLVIALLAYRNPAPPQSDKSLTDALRTLADLRRDPLYLALLLFYAGFWFMYAQQQFFLPKYAVDFGVLPPGFNVALVAIINPATIIFVGPVIGLLFQRTPSLPVIVLGTLIAIAGYVVVATVTTADALLVGTILFSVGEVMVQPNFLSYTSKIAPKDRAAVYLGYSFLPVGVGLTLGSAVGGVMYHQFAEVAHTPSYYWALTCLAGVFAMAGILALNRVISRRRADPSGELGPRAKRVVHSRAAPLAVLLIIPVLLVAGAAPGTQTYTGGAGEGPFAAAALAPVSGATPEGQESHQGVHVTAAQARNLTFTLRWTDEPAPAPGATNQPDQFQLTVAAPDGTRTRSDPGANPPGAEGVLRLAVPTRPGAADGAYDVTIALLQAGDVTLGPVPAVQDTGNAWTLEVGYDAPRAG